VISLHGETGRLKDLLSQNSAIKRTNKLNREGREGREERKNETGKTTTPGTFILRILCALRG
jgi:hypothetical protein